MHRQVRPWERVLTLVALCLLSWIIVAGLVIVMLKVWSLVGEMQTGFATS